MSEGSTEEDDLPTLRMKENSVMSVKRSDDNIQCVEKRLGKVDEFEQDLVFMETKAAAGLQLVGKARAPPRHAAPAQAPAHWRVARGPRRW